MLYGSGMGDANQHVPEQLPTLLVSGSGISIEAGRHVRYARGTPIANLHVTMADKVGVHIERFGDSTGPLAGL
jgi:hypothetical protein